MKHIILISLVLAVFALVFPILTALRSPIPDAAVPPSENSEPVTEDTIEPSDQASPMASFDSSFTITMLNGEESIIMTMEDFLIGAVSAEMPAGFESDALMAQAVALRTYALHKIHINPSSAHEENICSDSSCCAAWRSEDALREKWGEDYDKYIQKIYSAVSSTDGVYLSYEEEPILAAFHSSSAGYTQSSDAVWSGSLPYLVSVESPETGEDVPNYNTTVTVLFSDFTRTVKNSFPSADFSGEPSTWIGSTVYDSSGRLKSVKLGGAEVKGTELRSLFSLRSTAVEITCSVEDNAVIFSVTGYGHGVGMSQYGANVMAKGGSGWQEILTWYYPNTTLENMKETDQN